MFITAEAVIPILSHLHQLLCQTCTKSASEVLEEEAIPTHRLLHDAAEHPDGKHIEEEVRQVSMHEHVGERLPGTEAAGQEEMQTEQLIKVYAVRSKHIARKEA